MADAIAVGVRAADVAWGTGHARARQMLADAGFSDASFGEYLVFDAAEHGMRVLAVRHPDKDPSCRHNSRITKLGKDDPALGLESHGEAIPGRRRLARRFVQVGDAYASDVRGVPNLRAHSRAIHARPSRNRSRHPAAHRVAAHAVR